MTTTHVSTEQLDEMANDIRRLATTVESAHPPMLASCGETGRPRVEQAFEAFSTRWTHYLASCRTEIEHMARLTQLAAEAYHRQDGRVGQAADVSAVTKVGGGR